MTAIKSLLIIGLCTLMLPIYTYAHSPSAFRFKGDDVKHSVPLDEVHLGIRSSFGSPRDKIKPIDEPKFRTVRRTRMWSSDARVLVVSEGDKAKAYPIGVLNRHEVVNDSLGHRKIAVVYCPLCGSGTVFDRLVNGKLRRFGVSGYLYKSDVLLWDDVTESFWSQIKGEAVVGPDTGTKLTWLPVENTTFGDFHSRFPKGLVLTGPYGDSIYKQQAYAGWEKKNSPGLFMNSWEVSPKLHMKAVVTGVVVAGEAFAIPHESIKRFGRAASVKVARRNLSIEYHRDADLVRVFVHLTDGSRRPLTTLRAFWFAWSAFHPDTALFDEDKASLAR